MDTIPYTHWMYFRDRDAAGRCAAELAGLDFLCGIDENEPLNSTYEEDAERAADLLHRGDCDERTYQILMRDAGKPSPLGDYGWLLRAAHECPSVATATAGLRR